MNYRGSYRKLLGNAKAAAIAAIEIYNKPAFHYRDECVVILLLNAWELILKALLSKNGQSIFYLKRRKEPYRTFSCQHAFVKAEPFLPKTLPALPIRRNLELLSTYRDNAVHFYNATDFGVVIYALAQTSIKNFRDLLHEAFNVKLENEVSWQLLPLGIRPPMDVISYIAGKGSTDKKQSGAVRQFLSELAAATNEIKADNGDTGRLLTVFHVKLESVKRIGDADIVVGVEKAEGSSGPLAIVKTQDPNITHPLRQKDIIQRIGTLHGKKFNPHVFQAIAWKHDLKTKSQYCWKAQEGVLTKYSHDIFVFLNTLTEADVEAAMKDYRHYLQTKTKRK